MSRFHSCLPATLLGCGLVAIFTSAASAQRGARRPWMPPRMSMTRHYMPPMAHMQQVHAMGGMPHMAQMHHQQALMQMHQMQQRAQLQHMQALAQMQLRHVPAHTQHVQLQTTAQRINAAAQTPQLHQAANAKSHLLAAYRIPTYSGGYTAPGSAYAGLTSRSGYAGGYGSGSYGGGGYGGGSYGGGGSAGGYGGGSYGGGGSAGGYGGGSYGGGGSAGGGGQGGFSGGTSSSGPAGYGYGSPSAYGSLGQGGLPVQSPYTALAAVPSQPSVGRIEVILPHAGGDVWFDGKKATGAGQRRLYVSAPLQPDAALECRVVAAWGAGHRVERKVQVMGGLTAIVDCTVPWPTTTFQPASPPYGLAGGHGAGG